MYFSLSKLLPALIMPYSLLFAVLILILIQIRKGKNKQASLALIGTIILLYLMSLPLPPEYHNEAKIAKWRHIEPAKDTVDAVVVLGGFMQPDSLNGYNVGAAFDRLLGGIRILKQKKASYLILSGGVSPFEQRKPESVYMKAFIDEFLTIPDSLIIVEKKSTTTHENALFSAEIVDSLHISKKIYLVSSVDHLSRAILQFESFGFDVLPVPVDFPVVVQNEHRFPFYLIPSIHSVSYWSNEFREWLGYWFYYFY